MGHKVHPTGIRLGISKDWNSKWFANKALFFPINPGAEEASWKRLLDEGIDRFVKGTFAGAYQKQLNDEFDSYLPATPSWKTT